MVEEVDVSYRKLPPPELPPPRTPLVCSPPIEDLAKRCHTLLRTSKLTSQSLFDYVCKKLHDSSLSLTRRLELFLLIDRIFATEHRRCSSPPPTSANSSSSSPPAANSVIVSLAAKVQSAAFGLVICVCPPTVAPNSDYEGHRERAMCIVTMRELVERWLTLNKVFNSTRMLRNAKNRLSSMQLPDLDSLMDDRGASAAGSSSDADDVISSFPKRNLTAAEHEHHRYTERARHNQKHERVKGNLRREGEDPDAEFNEYFDAVFRREQPWEHSEAEFKLFWDWRPQTVELAREVRRKQRLADPPQSAAATPRSSASSSSSAHARPFPSPSVGAGHSQSPDAPADSRRSNNHSKPEHAKAPPDSTTVSVSTPSHSAKSSNASPSPRNDTVSSSGEPPDKKRRLT